MVCQAPAVVMLETFTFTYLLSLSHTFTSTYRATRPLFLSFVNSEANRIELINRSYQLYPITLHIPMFTKYCSTIQYFEYMFQICQCVSQGPACQSKALVKSLNAGPVVRTNIKIKTTTSPSVCVRNSVTQVRQCDK